MVKLALRRPVSGAAARPPAGGHRGPAHPHPTGQRGVQGAPRARAPGARPWRPPGRHRLPAAAVTDVVIGNAVGGGGNVARLAALEAGLPVSVPGVTVDRQCGSGLDAIVLAARLVAAGGNGVYLAGGSRKHQHRSPAAPTGQPTASPEFFRRAQFVPLSFGDPDMGAAADNVAEGFRHQPRRQDRSRCRATGGPWRQQHPVRSPAKSSRCGTASGNVEYRRRSAGRPDGRPDGGSRRPSRRAAQSPPGTPVSMPTAHPPS